MTRVEFDMNEKLRAEMNGHAGYSDEGNDIVCASASILIQTLAQSAYEMDEKGYLLGRPIIILESGYARIECVPDEDHWQYAKDVFTTIQTGFALLDNDFGDYICLTTVEQA